MKDARPCRHRRHNRNRHRQRRRQLLPLPQRLQQQQHQHPLHKRRRLLRRRRRKLRKNLKNDAPFYGRRFSIRGRKRASKKCRHANVDVDKAQTKAGRALHDRARGCCSTKTTKTFSRRLRRLPRRLARSTRGVMSRAAQAWHKLRPHLRRRVPQRPLRRRRPCRHVHQARPLGLVHRRFRRPSQH